ncbi:unnamed protein product [Cunninghamella echinulata]
MGQTVSSQVDYTFGVIANSSEAGSSLKHQRTTKQQQQNIVTLDKRILLYPEQYGFKDTYNHHSIKEEKEEEEEEQPICIDLLSSSTISSSSSSSSSSLSSSSNDSTTLTKQIDRIDSGYGDEDGFYSIKVSNVSPSSTSSSLSSLTEDISYVDEIYYPDYLVQPQQLPLSSSTDHHPIQLNGTNFTFAAAALASQDISMREIYLPRRSLINLSDNIGLLTCLRKLDLYNNQLESLPETIGQLKQLEVLILAKNQLQQLPDSIQYLTRLIELDVSHNQLKEIKSLGNFTSLSTLLISNNLIESLPSDINGMKQIITIDLSNNPLKVLPAEIIRLSHLRRLKLESCRALLDIDPDNAMEYNVTHDPPSLLEICSRKIMSSSSSSPNKNKKTNIIQQKANIMKLLPEHLLTYLGSAKTCSSCHGPYFESYVLRGRLIEKNDTWIPLEYRLCSAHWSDEKDRLLNLFHQETSHHQDDLKNNILFIHKLLGYHQLEDNEEVDVKLLSSRRMSFIDNSNIMDDLDTTATTGKLSSFVRHPQRLQKVMNRNPSSFLLSKIQRK